MTAEPSDELGVCLAIPFYSNLEYLRRALQSVVAQTDPNWTAIVVDDASPESGVEALVAAVADQRITYVRNDHNLGIAANFNRCLELGRAVADIVTVFHADDELAPGYVAAVRAAHERFPDATCVAPRVDVIDAAGSPTRTLGDSVKEILWPRRLPRTLTGDAGLSRLMHGLFFYCPSVSYRVDRLQEPWFDPRWRQVMDLDLFARVLLNGGSITLIPESAYRYRRHADTMTAQNSRSLLRLQEEVAVSGQVATEARNKGWHRAARSAALRTTVRLNGVVEAGRLAASRQPGVLAALRLAIRCGTR